MTDGRETHAGRSSHGATGLRATYPRGRARSGATTYHRDVKRGRGGAARGRAVGAVMLATALATVAIACNALPPRLTLLTAAPGQTVGNGVAPGQTPVTMVALPADYTTRGPWQINYTGAGHETIREVVVVVPTCESGTGCDLTAALQTIDGDPITTSTFAWKQGTYELATSWDTRIDCTASDVTVKGGATEHVEVSLVLGEYRAYGSAVKNPRVTGTRTVATTPVGDSGCQPSTATYGADGGETTFASSDFPFLPGGFPIAGLSPTWTAEDLATAKTYSTSMLVSYATVALMALYVIDPGCTASPADCATAEYRSAATRALAAHLAMMRAHPASTCFADAYAADRKLAAQWQKVLKAPISATAYEASLKGLDRFARAFQGYFADCG